MRTILRDRSYSLIGFWFKEAKEISGLTGAGGGFVGSPLRWF